MDPGFPVGAEEEGWGAWSAWSWECQPSLKGWCQPPTQVLFGKKKVKMKTLGPVGQGVRLKCLYVDPPLRGMIKYEKI